MTANNTGLLTITIVIITAMFGILILPSAEISGEVFSVSPGNFMVMQSGSAMMRASGETITCRFTGSTQNNWCKIVGIERECRGIGSCSLNIRADYGRQVMITSSCGGSYTVKIDGINENLDFSCFKPTDTLDYVKYDLASGNSRTLTLKGTEYKVKVVYLSGQQAKFEINGEITEIMLPYNVHKLADGGLFIMTTTSNGAGRVPLAGFIIVR